MLSSRLRWHPGAVAAKYGVAAWLTDTLARWAVPHDRLSAVFVALICCQPSLVSGVKRGWEQILASATGVGTSAVLMALFPPGSWVIGLGIAITYAVGAAIGWPFPTLIVALFSSLYMGLYTQATVPGTALLRCQAVGMGVLAALVINLAFAPLLRGASLKVRLDATLGLVHDRLAALVAAIEAGKPVDVRDALGSWETAFQSVAGVEEDLADLRADSRLAPAQSGEPPRSARAEMAVRALEQVLHHALDVGNAVARLWEDPPEDGPRLVALARASLGAATEVLACLRANDLAGGARLAREQLMHVREVDRAVSPPRALDERLGPRLIVLVGLAELHHHLGRVAQAMTRLDEGGSQP